MKICPLITQVSLVDENDRELLIGVAETGDLAENAAEEMKEGREGIFINPDVAGEPLGEDGAESSGGGTGAGTPGRDFAVEPRCGERPVRFVARSIRGEVSCLGERCRFHDDESGGCRIEMLLRADHDGRSRAAGESVAELRGEIENASEAQRRSTVEIVDLLRETREKYAEAAASLRADFAADLKGISDQLTSVTDDNKVIIESLTDTLAERSEDLENKLSESRRNIEDFRTEVAAWKEALDRNIERLETSAGENRKLVHEVSENNAEIMKLVENQKETLAQEEQRRRLAEAKRLNNAGVAAYHNGQYEKALELFRRAIDINPDFTEGYNNLGLTYTEMQAEEKATEAFKKAIELNPDLAATYNNLGYVFYRLGSYSEAIEMYNEAIGRSGNNSSAYTNLGNAHYKLDRIEDAVSAWEKALEIDPSNEKAQRNLKRFHAEAQR